MNDYKWCVRWMLRVISGSGQAVHTPGHYQSAVSVFRNVAPRWVTDCHFVIPGHVPRRAAPDDETAAELPNANHFYYETEIEPSGKHATCYPHGGYITAFYSGICFVRPRWRSIDSKLACHPYRHTQRQAGLSHSSNGDRSTTAQSEMMLGL